MMHTGGPAIAQHMLASAHRHSGQLLRAANQQFDCSRGSTELYSATYRQSCTTDAVRDSAVLSAVIIPTAPAFTPAASAAAKADVSCSVRPDQLEHPCSTDNSEHKQLAALVAGGSVLRARTATNMKHTSPPDTAAADQDTASATAVWPATPSLVDATACFSQQVLQHARRPTAAVSAAGNTAVAEPPAQCKDTLTAANATAMPVDQQLVATETPKAATPDQFHSIAALEPRHIAALGPGGTVVVDQASVAVALPASSASATPCSAACDDDALEAAAHLLMLQAAAPQQYTGLSCDATACGSADAAAVVAVSAASGTRCKQPVPADTDSNRAVITTGRKRPRKPQHKQQQLQQEQPAAVEDTAAAADQQQQEQDDTSQPERRSKRARKTSYKAVQAAEADTVFAELLRPAGRAGNNSPKAAAAATNGGGFDDQEQQTISSGQITSSTGSQPQPNASNPLQQLEPGAQTEPSSKGLQQQLNRTAATRKPNARQQKQRQHSDSDEDATAAVKRRPSLPSNKRCVVRTSLVPVATAVQQKLQHVVSFFPDVQLPGAAQGQPQQGQEQLALSSVAAAGGNRQGDAAALELSAAALSEAADGSWEPTPEQLQQPLAPPTATAGSKQSSPGPKALPLNSSKHLQDAQAAVADGSIATTRSRRTPRPVSTRSSSSSSPPPVKAPRSRSRLTCMPQLQQLQQANAEMAVNESNAAADAAHEAPAAAGQAFAASGGKNKGGRPRGSGNKHQMAPRATDRTGKAGFALRSAKYTGVYQSRRAHEGWRAQFCFSNKVLNLGTYATEDDAARAWNAAALFFRGDKTWLNPVKPSLPDDYVAGSLGSSVPAATATAAAQVVAKARQ